MNDEDLRDFFAGLAMISKAWMPSSIDDQAKMCYELADAMIAAKYAQPEVGIKAAKPRRKKADV